MIAFRPANRSDRNFVVSTWSTSFRRSMFAGFVSMNTWSEVMHDQIDEAMGRPHVRTLVACAAADPTVLYGFIMATPSMTPPLVYYTYVKEPYRRRGIARSLFTAVGVNPSKAFDYVCRTPWTDTLSDKAPFASWNPLAGRYDEYWERR